MDTDTRQIYNFKEGEMFDNRYRLQARAGSGGFADVWRAEDMLTHKVVALKIYTRLDEEGINDLAKEYTGMADIQHPNLLTGKHFAAMGNIPYLGMRYCDGGNLEGKAGKMSAEELRHVACDVCNGLVFLHQEGIVHQDIKPENVLYDTTHDRYMLSDFGISGKSRTRMSKSASHVNPSLAMTVAYAPPEKFSTNAVDRMPDTKGDIFSLGLALYELAAGGLPIDPPMATGREMLYSRGQMQVDFDRVADPLLKMVVQRCLSYRKEDRPTAKEVLAMLEGKPADEKVGGHTVKVGGSESLNPGGGSVSSSGDKPSKNKYKTLTDEEQRKWNWGAFAFGWMWGVINGVNKYLYELPLNVLLVVGVLCIGDGDAWLFVVPLVMLADIVVKVIFGRNGTREAWNGSRMWSSTIVFKNTQQTWLIFSMFMLATYLVILISMVVGFIGAM